MIFILTENIPWKADCTGNLSYLSSSFYRGSAGTYYIKNLTVKATEVPEPEVKTIYSMDLSGFTAGEKISESANTAAGITVTGETGSDAVTVEEIDGEKAIRFYKTTATETSPSLAIPLTGAEGYIELTAKVKGPEAGAIAYTLSLCKDTDVMAQVYHRSGGSYANPTIWYLNQSGADVGITQYDVNTWQNIKVLVDPETRTYDLYLNGILVGDNIPWRTQTAGNGAILTSGYYRKSGGTFYLKDVTVRCSEAPIPVDDMEAIVMPPEEAMDSEESTEAAESAEKTADSGDLTEETTDSEESAEETKDSEESTEETADSGEPAEETEDSEDSAEETVDSGEPAEDKINSDGPIKAAAVSTIMGRTALLTFTTPAARTAEEIAAIMSKATAFTFTALAARAAEEIAFDQVRAEYLSSLREDGVGEYYINLLRRLSMNNRFDEEQYEGLAVQSDIMIALIKELNAEALTDPAELDLEVFNDEQKAILEAAFNTALDVLGLYLDDSQLINNEFLNTDTEGYEPAVIEARIFDRNSRELLITIRRDGGVKNWSLIDSADDLEETVTEGDEFALPAEIAVTMGDGSGQMKPVIWDGEADTGKAGTFTFKGYVAEYPEMITFTLTVESKGEQVDKATLQKLYDENKDRAEDGYTVDSWNAFKAALQKADEVLKNVNASQKEVDEAEKALSAAIAGLEKQSSGSGDNNNNGDNGNTGDNGNVGDNGNTGDNGNAGDNSNTGAGGNTDAVKTPATGDKAADLIWFAAALAAGGAAVLIIRKKMKRA